MRGTRAALPPTPRTLYVHDDLTADVERLHGRDSEAFRRAAELMATIRGDGRSVVVLELEAQIAGLVARRPWAPFDVAVGIGAAGERVAQQVNARTGWFPRIRGIVVAREENAAGGYDLSMLGAPPLARQLAPLREGRSIALVDDTVFSGLTMRSVLRALPRDTLARTHAFCLRAVAETLTSLEHLCPVTAGFVAPGRLLEDVSFINASGLVRRGAIRRVGRRPLAFYERPQWMRAWFPGRADEVVACCRALRAQLEGQGVAR